MEKIIFSYPPIIHENSIKMIIGTMPSVKSLEKKEYYAHPQNAFWKILFEIHGLPYSAVYDVKKQLLLSQNIALWDVIHSCSRKGSLDENIIDPEANDFESLFLTYSGIRDLYFNGQNAAKFFKKLTKDQKLPDDLIVHVMPSTSPANVKAYSKKRDEWKSTLYPELIDSDV